jgi:hypothetical protein
LEYLDRIRGEGSPQSLRCVDQLQAEGGRSFETLVKEALAELVFCLASCNGLELGIIKGEYGDRKIAVFLGNPRKGRYMVWSLPDFVDAVDDVVKGVQEKPSCCGIVDVNEKLDEDLAVRINDWIRREYEVAHRYDPKLPELWRKGWIPGESDKKPSWSVPLRASKSSSGISASDSRALGVDHQNRNGSSRFLMRLVSRTRGKSTGKYIAAKQPGSMGQFSNWCCLLRLLWKGRIWTRKYLSRLSLPNLLEATP